MPHEISARVMRGWMRIVVSAPRAMHFAIALWSDAAFLRVADRPVVAAGRAGIVLPVRLRRGTQTIVVRCAGCASSVLPYAT